MSLQKQQYNKPDTNHLLNAGSHNVDDSNKKKDRIKSCLEAGSDILRKTNGKTLFEHIMESGCLDDHIKIALVNNINNNTYLDNDMKEALVMKTLHKDCLDSWDLSGEKFKRFCTELKKTDNEKKNSFVSKLLESGNNNDGMLELK